VTDVRMSHRFDHLGHEMSDDSDGGSTKIIPWSDHLSVLLCGIQDKGSPLSLLRGFESTLVRGIYETVVEYWREHISLTPPAHAVARFRDPHERESSQENRYEYDNAERNGHLVAVRSFLLGANSSESVLLGNRVQDRPQVAFSRCGIVEFPNPANRNVNMLPFILGSEDSLPEYLRPYYGLIQSCPVHQNELGKVCYLTICESFVKAGETQRRAGLHTEAPGAIQGPGGTFTAAWEHHWGMGMAYTDDTLEGGLFIASNLDSTCEVWNALIDPAGGIADSQGGVEHLRPYLGEGSRLCAGELVWLTDRTPHEALPQREDGYRQFFRLVTSNVSLWFKAHSTPNPKVPLPSHVKIIEGSKFMTGDSV